MEQEEAKPVEGQEGDGAGGRWGGGGQAWGDGAGGRWSRRQPSPVEGWETPAGSTVAQVDVLARPWANMAGWGLEPVPWYSSPAAALSVPSAGLPLP